MTVTPLPDSTPWQLDQLKQPPAFRWLDAAAPVKPLLYAGEPYGDVQTEVFAWFATPGSVADDSSLDVDLPGIVLVHGGGGTAFLEWTEMWAQRGYAAIAMDLGGEQPVPMEGKRETDGSHGLRTHGQVERQRLEKAGPDQSHDTKFDAIGEPVDRHWPYHAIANVTRAHSLLASFDFVDPKRIGITGISWGGYTTCIAASVDDRYAAAAPVYGCGFLHDGESCQRSSIDKHPPELRDKWIELYEPSRYLASCTTPMLFVNGTNDPHYPLDSYARSYRLVQGPRNLRIETMMQHGHPPGWRPREIGIFIDSYCKGGVPLPVISQPCVNSSGIEAQFDAETSVKEAALHYTTDTGPLKDRTWHTQPARIDQQMIHAPKPPADATLWLLSLTDERDAMVSSEVVFAPASDADG